MRIRQEERKEIRKKHIRRGIMAAVLLILVVVVAIQLWPHSVIRLLEKAETQVQKGKYEKAAELYLEVLEKEPENTAALVGLVKATKETKDVKTAELATRKLIELIPEEEQYYQWLIKIYVNTDRPEKADAVLRQWHAVKQEKGL